MCTKSVFAVVAVVLGVSAGQALAGEGNGDPFPFATTAQVRSGGASMADTGSGAYPEATGTAAQLSQLPQLEPAIGSEAIVQTAQSLPRGFGDGSVAAVQAASVDRYMTAQGHRAHQTAGTASSHG